MKRDVSSHEVLQCSYARTSVAFAIRSSVYAQVERNAQAGTIPRIKTHIRVQSTPRLQIN